MELENENLKANVRRLEGYVATTDLEALENENEVLRSSIRHFTSELERSQEEVSMWSSEMEERTTLVEARIVAERQVSVNRLHRTTVLAAAAMSRARHTGFVLSLVTAWRGTSASDQGFRRRAEKEARRLREELSQVENMERELSRLAEVELSMNAKEQILESKVIAATSTAACRARRKERESYGLMQWKLLLSRDGTDNAAQRARGVMQQELKNAKHHSSQVAGVKLLLDLLVTRPELRRKMLGFQRWCFLSHDRQMKDNLEDEFALKQRGAAQDAEEGALRRVRKIKKDTTVRVLFLQLKSQTLMAGSRAFYQWAQTRGSRMGAWQEEEARRLMAEERAEEVALQASTAHRKLKVKAAALMMHRSICGGLERSLQSAFQWWLAVVAHKSVPCAPTLLQEEIARVKEETLREVEAVVMDRDVVVREALHQLQRENEELSRELESANANIKAGGASIARLSPEACHMIATARPSLASSRFSNSPAQQMQPAKGSPMPLPRARRHLRDKGTAATFTTPSLTPTSAARPLPKHPTSPPVVEELPEEHPIHRVRAEAALSPVRQGLEGIGRRQEVVHAKLSLSPKHLRRTVETGIKSPSLPQAA